MTAKIMFLAACFVMIASSLVQNYNPYSDQDDAEWVYFILGKFINGYIVNIWIIMCYFYNYQRLKSHYDQVRMQYSKFISTYEKDAMRDTLTSLRIFFSCIC